MNTHRRQQGFARVKWVLFLGGLIAIAVVGLVAYQANQPSSRIAFDVAQARCGHPPVIGSTDANGKTFYTPGANNALLSQYSPSDLSLGGYADIHYFCSTEQAKQAGYGVHSCCGLYPAAPSATDPSSASE